MKNSWMSGVRALGTFLVFLTAEGACAGDARDRRSRRTISRDYYDARALFEKVWVLGEDSPPGGDGVGPLHNELSCVG